MPDFVKIEIESGVGKLTLNRPAKRNALKRQFIEEIHSGVSELEANPSLRVFLLEAEGSAFCAGMDLAEMQQRAESENGQQQWHRDSEVFAETLSAIFRLPVPTIAKIQGPVVAGGMGLVLACDILLASDQAFFMLPEPMRGITASMVTPFLIHRVGSGSATYMLLSGERIEAMQAKSLGMCHDVVPHENLGDRCDQMVATVLTGSQAALAITKQHLQQCAPTDVLNDLSQSIAVSAKARETSDAREGLTAFLEKRKPSWQSD